MFQYMSYLILDTDDSHIFAQSCSLPDDHLAESKLFYIVSSEHGENNILKENYLHK